MEGGVASLAAWEEFGGSVVAFQMCEDVTARIDPCRIAEAADRAERRPDKLARAEHVVLDWCDSATLCP